MNQPDNAAAAQAEIRIRCMGKALLKTGADVLRGLGKFITTDFAMLMVAWFVIVGALAALFGVGRFYMHFMGVGKGAAFLLTLLTCVLAYAACRLGVRVLGHYAECLDECEAGAGRDEAA